MKLFQAFLFILSIFVYSQNNLRFVFKYDFAPSSKAKDSLVTNYMHLDTNGNTSNFYNEVKFKVDSIKKTSNDFGQILNAGKMDKNLHYNIQKSYSNKDITYYTKFTTLDLKIPETENLIWQLIDEKKTMGSWNCQKAETFYKGRKWIAWFTSEIPINDGPYKFWGLPGFIVDIYDSEKLHHFSLIQIKKVAQPNLPEAPKNARTVTYTQYQDYLRKYRPSVADIEAVNVVNGTSTYMMKDGSRVNIYISKETLNKYDNNREKLGEMIFEKLGGQNENPIEKL